MFYYTRSLTEGVLEAGAPSRSRGCRVERQLIFHNCGAGSYPGRRHGFNLLLVLFSFLRSLSQECPKNQHFPVLIVRCGQCLQLAEWP